MIGTESSNARLLYEPIRPLQRGGPKYHHSQPMISDLQIRRVAIAYLYQGSLTPGRDDNISFYDEITSGGVELPEMNQQRQELVLLHRPSPGQAFEVRVGAMVPAAQPPPGVFVQSPLRLLIAEAGATRPLKFFLDSADTIYSAFQRVWGPRAGQIQLVEVSLIATTAINHPQGAAGFIKERLSKTSSDLDQKLGRDFEGITLKLTSLPGISVATGGAPAHNLPLAGASIDLTFEPNAQDAAQMALTALVKWQTVQVPLHQMQLPAEVRAAMGGRDFLQLNADARAPAKYVSEVYDYLETRVKAFLSVLGR